MIDFTEYIGFFRVFDLLVGGKNDQIYWINILNYFRLLDLSTSCWEVKMIDFTEYIGIFRFLGLLLGGQLSDFTGYIAFFRLFDFSTSCREVKMIDFTDYIWFSHFSTFGHLGGSSKWIILLKILFFLLFDFSTSWWEV